MRQRLVITIDGPSGAGKSTMAKLLASALGYTYMDTGATYRAVAYAYTREKNQPDLEPFLRELVLRFVFGDETQVFLDGEDISRKIRDPEISLLASALSQDLRVRKYLTKLQREMGKDGGIVLEGRDTGSVVFPDADVKFFLDADVNERAGRRYRELLARSPAEDLERVKETRTTQNGTSLHSPGRTALFTLTRPALTSRVWCVSSRNEWNRPCDDRRDEDGSDRFLFRREKGRFKGVEGAGEEGE
jgi:cytidylate kinase